MKSRTWIEWQSENQDFWHETGAKIAWRNLAISVPALLLAFAVWQVWSVIAAQLPDVGFNYSERQLFALAALPGLTGALLRFPYTYVVPYIGGRNWTVISTGLLLFPAIGIGFAVQNPTTPFWVMALLAFTCGFGGGNFASSMVHISFLFPKHVKGTALGINGGIGNLGVSFVQLLAPLVISFGVFGIALGNTQKLADGREVWLQMAAWMWVIPITIVCILAWKYMDNLSGMQSSFSTQGAVLKDRKTLDMTLLYIMSFGSFIGFAAAFPLLIKYQFPLVNVFSYAFIGPLLGAAIRPLGGWLADKFGGAIVTRIVTLAMILAVLTVFYSLYVGSFLWFLLAFVSLFTFAGIGNGSIFGLIPQIYQTKEAAAVVGFTSAVAAFGGFFIPMGFGWNISEFGHIYYVLLVMLMFYSYCMYILRKY